MDEITEQMEIDDARKEAEIAAEYPIQDIWFGMVAI